MGYYENQQKALEALKDGLNKAKRAKDIVRISALILEMQRKYPIGDAFIMKKIEQLQMQDSKMIINKAEDIIKWLD